MPTRLPLSFAGRMAWAMVLLLLLVQFASLWAVRTGVEAQARAEVDANLVVGERLFRRLLEQNHARLRDAAVVLAADFGFRSAIGSGDVQTIASALENSSARIGAEVAIFVDANWQAVSATRELTPNLEAALASLQAGLAQGGPERQLVLLQGRPYQFVAAPVRAPVVVGWVLMGFPLDQRLVEDFQQLSSIHAAVLAAAPQQPLRVVVASLPLAPQAWQQASPQAPRAIDINGEALEMQAWALPATGGQLQVVLARSLNEVLGPFRALERLLVLITGVGVLLFALGSRWAAGRVTLPLARLTQATGKLEAGQFNVAIEGTRRRDEVGQLARGFDRMQRSLAAQRAEILQLAYADTLTGLPNREQFLSWLRQAVAQAPENTPAAILVLNLNRFKHVNEVLGYAFGDRLLQAVAARLQSLPVSNNPRIARLGGDRFALLLQPASVPMALALAQRVHDALAQPLEFDDQTVDLSASLGVALWPEHANTAETWLSRAEMAMQTAKTQVAETRLFHPDLDSSSARNLSLLSELRHAIEHGELRLHLQPKIHIRTGRTIGAEALVRWQHPHRGLIPPYQFIPFAEQTGFIRQLTLWVFEATVQASLALREQHPQLRLALNLSTRDLMDARLPEKLQAVLHRHQATAAGLALEITESAIMDDPQRAETTLRTLAGMGFTLSIDDFGTGYSSLAYLKRLPVHELKIDQSFVKGMLDDASDAKIVRSTIDLAHNLGLHVVAEGVETVSLLPALREQGCDFAQGYGIARPMPAEQMANWLQESSYPSPISG